MDKFTFVCGIVDKVASWVITVALAVMAALTFGQVVLRYVFARPTSWGEELTMIVFTWTVLIGAGIATRKAKHLVIDTFVRKFSPTVQTYFRIGLDTVAIIFMIAIATAGMSMALIVRTSVSAALRIPMFYVYLSVPVGCALIALFSAEDLVAVLRQLIKNSAGVK